MLRSEGYLPGRYQRHIRWIGTKITAVIFGGSKTGGFLHSIIKERRVDELMTL